MLLLTDSDRCTYWRPEPTLERLNCKFSGQRQVKALRAVQDISQIVVVVRSKCVFTKASNVKLVLLDWNSPPYPTVSSFAHCPTMPSLQSSIYKSLEVSYATHSFYHAALVLAHQPQCPQEPPPRPSVQTPNHNHPQRSLLPNTASPSPHPRASIRVPSALASSLTQWS